MYISGDILRTLLGHESQPVSDSVNNERISRTPTHSRVFELCKYGAGGPGRTVSSGWTCRLNHALSYAFLGNPGTNFLFVLLFSWPIRIRGGEPRWSPYTPSSLLARTRRASNTRSHAVTISDLHAGSMISYCVYSPTVRSSSLDIPACVSCSRRPR